jgi:hypothetical protein
MPLTSQPDPDTALALSEWQAAGLLNPTWVKPIIGSLSTRLILRRLGKLAGTDDVCVKSSLGNLLAHRWT